MPRHQHALPRRERSIELGAQPTRAAALSDSISRSRASVRGSSVERLDLLQRARRSALRIRAFQAPSVSRSSTEPGAHDLLDFRDERRRRPHADLRRDVHAHAQMIDAARSRTTRAGRRGAARRSRPAPRTAARCAGAFDRIATSRASRSRTLSSGAISDARIRTDSSSRSSLPRTSTSVPVSIRPRAALDRSRETRSPRRRPARPRA